MKLPDQRASGVSCLKALQEPSMCEQGTAAHSNTRCYTRSLVLAERTSNTRNDNLHHHPMATAPEPLGHLPPKKVLLMPPGRQLPAGTAVAAFPANEAQEYWLRIKSTLRSPCFVDMQGPVHQLHVTNDTMYSWALHWKVLRLIYYTLPERTCNLRKPTNCLLSS